MIFEYGLYYIIPNKFGKQMFGGTSGNTGLPAIPVSSAAPVTKTARAGAKAPGHAA